MFNLNKARQIATSIIQEQGWSSASVYHLIGPSSWVSHDLVRPGTDDPWDVSVGSSPGGGFLFMDWVVIPVVLKYVKALSLRDLVVLLCRPRSLRRLYRTRELWEDWQDALMRSAVCAITDTIVKLLPEPAPAAI